MGLSRYVIRWTHNQYCMSGDFNSAVAIIHDEPINRIVGWFYIKMAFYQYRYSHYRDETFMRSSYFYNGNSYTVKRYFIPPPSPIHTPIPFDIVINNVWKVRLRRQFCWKNMIVPEPKNKVMFFGKMKSKSWSHSNIWWNRYYHCWCIQILRNIIRPIRMCSVFFGKTKHLCMTKSE